MSKKKLKTYNPKNLILAIEKWPNPMHDSKHGYDIYVEGRARSNQSRLKHIVKYGHDLKTRDLESIPKGITNYFDYKKDPVFKNTYNYYINRKGMDRGFIKVSIQVDHQNPQKAWIKTIYITYKVK